MPKTARDLDDNRIPITIGWLSENEILDEAAKILGYIVIPHSATKNGIAAMSSGGQVFLQWDENLLFTLAQLATLGFRLGDFEYCEHCHRLKAECDEEKAAIWDYNHAPEES